VIVQMRPPCGCDSCRAGKKIVNAAELARHLGVDKVKLRALVAAGLPRYTLPGRKFPSYSVAAADLWTESQGWAA
jgi:hypothetical protein